MRHPSFAIDCQMLKDIIENLLLIVKMCDNIPIELTLQLKPELLDVRYVIANLNRWQIIFVFFIAILSRLRN